MAIYNGYADDCIHLHACRRLSQIVKATCKKTVTRGCDPDKCTAYKTLSDYIEENPEEISDLSKETIKEICIKYHLYTEEQVQYAIDRASDDGASGYTWGCNIVDDYISPGDM